jgi:hypothetical protein
MSRASGLGFQVGLMGGALGLQIVNETLPALQKLKEQGLVRFIGITGLPLAIFPYILDRQCPSRSVA